jgi:MFS family permease
MDGKQKNSIIQKFIAAEYKWIVLANTTLGIIIAAIDGTIVLIALPAIFRGFGINPLLPDESNYLLWTIMGYLVVTSTLLVTFGRISDMFGRVRFYNLGFLIFAIGSVLLYMIQGTGNVAALQLVIFRLVQSIGAAFLFANSAAILTDAFPQKERGTALGINQIAFISGQFIGLILGGVLAAIDFRAVFLVSVPFSVGGTILSYLTLHEVAEIKKNQRFDIIGNLLFAGGLILILTGITYGIQPYASFSTGWTNPFVLSAITIGIISLTIFVFVEKKAKNPMFDLRLFSSGTFAAGNLAVLLSSLARGGLFFILVIWLQGVWLPLHGFNFEDTPFWAGIYMLPLPLGILIMGPLSGYLSDRFGPRPFTVGGMLLTTACFIALLFIPVNFSYPLFAVLLLILGIGTGVFFSPNTASIMNSVPPRNRGIASGMRATFQNTAMAFSIVFTFSLIIIGLATKLPLALNNGLTAIGISQNVASLVGKLPPTGALFAVFLGYNPLGTLLPAQVLNTLPSSTRTAITSTAFFPNLLISPLKDGLNLVFILSAALSFFAAVSSAITSSRRST